MSFIDEAVSSFMSFFFFFNDTATTEIYTLSLHDALPDLHTMNAYMVRQDGKLVLAGGTPGADTQVQTNMQVISHVDRKSTRLNSSHANISYAVFCLKKKKKTQ